MSPGAPGRPSGFTDTAAAYSSVTGFASLSTVTKPGLTAFTRIPCPPSSTAQALVIISMAALDVA
jgi:hypothetical protein